MAHLLRDLAIAGREAVLKVYPNFDFYDLREVEHLEFRRDPELAGSLVELTLFHRKSTPNGRADVVLCFKGVRKLVLPEIAPRFFLTELEIEDLSRDQLEGIRYRAFDNLDSVELEVFSRDLEIRLIQRL